jgi:C4-dicarboxylate-specific signal transduction histidine kinase
MALPEKSSILPLVAGAAALAIFAVDTSTHSEIAYSVLYVGVILLSVRFLDRRAVLWVTLGLIALATLSYVITAQGKFSTVGISNLLISVVAIGITAYIAIENETVHKAIRSTEDKLRKAEVELAHVNRTATLGELAASISHEVNQPLAAIMTNGEVCLRLLDQDQVDREELRALMADVISSSRRAGEIIQRVRALSKKAALDTKPVDVNDVLREAIALVQREFDGRGISLRSDLANTLPPVLGDRVLLQQVIINLMVNGMEAIESAHDAPRQLWVRSNQNSAGEIVVTVEDSGIGIAPNDTGRVFDAFFTTKPSGMGMGLSICKSIVEAHGGRILAVPNAGSGATFQVTLPRYASS